VRRTGGRASDDLLRLSGQTVGILAMLRPASGRGHRLTCPELVQAIQSSSWPGQSAMPTPTTGGSIYPRRDHGAFPTGDLDRASAFQGGEGAMNRAGRHVVTPGYLRQGGQQIAGLNRAAGDRAA
jgi:hypothetical protein